jgi:hypothetical protein
MRLTSVSLLDPAKPPVVCAEQADKFALKRAYASGERAQSAPLAVVNHCARAVTQRMNSKTNEDALSGE